PSRGKSSKDRVTIFDIAEQTGLSITAVSFALNGRKGISEKNRKRVLQVAEELGWAPASAARSLVGARTLTLGLVLARDPRGLGVESFYMQFFAGLEIELAPRGYSLLLQVAPDRESELATLETWRSSRRVDGVVLEDVRTDGTWVEGAIRRGALPSVVVGDPSVAGGLTSVWTDDAASMREAVAHLDDLGHRRIARVSGVGQLAHTRIRDDAFLDELDQRELDAVLVRTDYSLEAGARVTRELLQAENRPTALIFDNDVMAVAGLSVTQEMEMSGPTDGSLVAWDDSVLCAYTSPGLTALSHAVVAFGPHVARRFFDVLDGAEPGAFLDSTPALHVRGSTGKAPVVR